MIEYLYYWNEEQDEKGRNLGLQRGYEVGDTMKLVYKGKLEGEAARDSKTQDAAICEILFELFNINPPADYRGPSMSMGSVVAFNGKGYACDSVGFRRIEIDMTPQWNTGAKGQLSRPCK